MTTCWLVDPEPLDQRLLRGIHARRPQHSRRSRPSLPCGVKHHAKFMQCSYRLRWPIWIPIPQKHTETFIKNQIVQPCLQLLRVIFFTNHSKEEVHLSHLILARSVGHKPESHSNCEFEKRCDPGDNEQNCQRYDPQSLNYMVYLNVTWISESDLDLHQISVRLSSRLAWKLKRNGPMASWHQSPFCPFCRARNCEVIPLLGNHHIIWHRAGYQQAITRPTRFIPPLRVPTWDSALFFGQIR